MQSFRLFTEAHDLVAHLTQFFARHRTLRAYQRIRIVEHDTGTAEAQQHADQIWIGTKFWALAPDIQDFVLAHEIGHWVLSRAGLSTLTAAADAQGVDVWDNLPFAQSNMHEAFADCFASYHLDGDVKRRYPAWVKLVERLSAACH